MGLVEEGENGVTLLKTSDARSSGYNGASAIGGRDYGKVDWERVFAL